MIDIIVTRHPNLLKYIIKQGIADKNTPVIEHATARDIRGLHVCGELPYNLAELASSITVIPMRLTLSNRKALQSRDLTQAEIQKVAGKPVTYKVEKLKNRIVK